MVKGFNEAWRDSGRKESEISIRYQYHITLCRFFILTGYFLSSAISCSRSCRTCVSIRWASSAVAFPA